ncbi:hypothetical protein BP00DRAFT_260377 [Aspergillus indologenus CBS 114.80]|uniref:Secreted protein n=1 Tax=Aspergillus indologenus CBS 114.80 TaxID=1450541 RepID=A0A2V5HVJ1_9EURO|nr:hypothetical protein BP00DRAFT_260377 [Aspergillus indologenus CBS 114.80]
MCLAESLSLLLDLEAVACQSIYICSTEPEYRCRCWARRQCSRLRCTSEHTGHDAVRTTGIASSGCRLWLRSC